MTRREDLVAPELERARSSIVVAAGLLATSLIGIGQSVLMTAIVGPGEQTDAFLAAYSIALPVVLLASTLRGQLVPMFGPADQDGFHARAVEVASRAALLGAALAVCLLLIAPFGARLITRGLSHEAQETAVGVLLILSISAFMQFRAAALSAVLAGARRFETSAVLYVVSGTVALTLSGLTLPLVGVVGAAGGIFAGAVVLLAGHERHVRRYGVRLKLEPRWLRERGQLMLALSLTGYAALGLAQQFNLTIALGAVSGQVGAITVYTFAFLAILMLLTITNVSLGLVLLPDLVSSLRDGEANAAAAHLARVSSFALALLVPMLVAAAAYGSPLLLFILDPLFGHGDITLMAELIRIFCLLAIPTALMQTAITIAVAQGAWRLTLVTALGATCVQGAMTAVLAGDAATTVAAAHTGVAVLTALTFIGVLFGRRAADAARRVSRPVGAAVVLGSTVALPRLVLGSEPTAGAAAGALLLGVALYLTALWHLWPTVARPLLGRIVGPARP